MSQRYNSERYNSKTNPKTYFYIVDYGLSFSPSCKAFKNALRILCQKKKKNMMGNDGCWRQDENRYLFQYRSCGLRQFSYFIDPLHVPGTALYWIIPDRINPTNPRVGEKIISRP